MAKIQRIVVFGGTGYTGSNVVREAVARGHEVVSVSRSQPSAPVEGARYEVGDVQQLAPTVVPGADAVVATLSPRGDLAGRLVEVYGELARLSAATGARYLQVGGFSSLRPAPDAPRFVEGEVPEEYRAEAVEGEATRVLLAERAPADLDWVFVSPAGSYGAWAPGERTGTYRVGGEVALFDADGGSNVSGPDFAAAIVDEVEQAAHPRGHIGVAY
jgi:putative NADH-flavin reductase